MNYYIIQWIFIFFIYSFLGWVWECTYALIKDKKLINRGFLYGPIIPIYGFGAISVLIVTIPYEKNMALTYLIGMASATTLEYITGLLMEKIFEIRYWDYSENKFNINGYICLYAALCWGIFSVLLTKIIHPLIEKEVLEIPYEILYNTSFLMVVFFLFDAVVSTKSAFDIKRFLSYISRNINTLENMEQLVNKILTKLSVISGEIQEQLPDINLDINNYKEKIKNINILNINLIEKIQLIKGMDVDFIKNITLKMEKIAKVIEQNIINIKKIEDVDLINSSLDVLKKSVDTKKLEYRMDEQTYKRIKNTIRRNPTMVSKKFKNAVRYLKEMYNDISK